MANFSSRFRMLLLGIAVWAQLPSNGQRPIDSRQTSYLTYVYKLTDNEASVIYRKGLRAVDSAYFHTLVATFPTDSANGADLPPGHYLKTLAEGNKQMVYIKTVPDFDVRIFNNNTDLCVQVTDLEGNVICDARVRVRMKQMKFDERTQCYLDKKSNKKGLLKVTCGGHTAYYELARQFNNGFPLRAVRSIAYNTPVRYAWYPVDFAIHLPVDAVKSVVRGWPQGTVYRTERLFVNAFRKLACVFDGNGCSYKSYRFQYRHTGYLVFNKPMYMPGDTLKLKAFVTTQKGRTVNGPVDVILDTYEKQIKLAHLMPYQPGGYECGFVLHDSLELRLDRTYDVCIAKNSEKEYIRASFRYEDYELKKNKVEIRLLQDVQYRGMPYRIWISGRDDNGLNLYDARLEILAKPVEVLDYHEDFLFIPDTLYYASTRLAPHEETEVLIPDSLFPKANFTYSIHCRLITADNEMITDEKKIAYYDRKKDFDISLQADSLHVTYRENGLALRREVRIFGRDDFGNETELASTATPCSILINPFYAEYIFKTDSLKQTFDPSGEPSLLRCLSERTKDSLFVVVDNPRKIPFVYHVYRRSRERSRGYADSLSLASKTNGDETYFVCLGYVWGGRVMEDNYRIPFNERQLNIEVTQPAIVYPGQKTRVEIAVTDMEGDPAGGVDVTAFGLTARFGYEVPVLPAFDRESKGKKVINNFRIEQPDVSSGAGLTLDYVQWKLLAGLDSIEYYRFIYPEKGMYRFEYPAADGITQFAPFVVSEGELHPVHVVWVDFRPVYFSWAGQLQPYAFRIEPGFHQVRIRTATRDITLDSLYFSLGNKVIFSLDEDNPPHNVRMEKAGTELSASEKRQFYRYIMPYRTISGNSYGYIENGKNIQLLESGQDYRYGNHFAGPVAGQVAFHLLDSFSVSFQHEPYFEYEFSPGLLKMRSMDENRYPKYLNLYQWEQGLADQVLTKEGLMDRWNEYLNTTRFTRMLYRQPSSTPAGAGRLHIGYSGTEGEDQELPLNILVTHYEDPDFIRVYPGSTTMMHQLGKGFHQLILFYSGSRYAIADSILIRPDGLTHYTVNARVALEKDSFSMQVSRLIEKMVYRQRPEYAGKNELQEIYAMYQEQFLSRYTDQTVEGFVYDNLTGEPLPGVTIYVEGTSRGTLTDMNGHYVLYGIGAGDELVYSFVGYATEQVRVGLNQWIDVVLNEEVTCLEEVVVVGYGVESRKSITGSVATVVAGRIPGIVSDDVTGQLQGNMSGVSVRGFASLGDAEPLYIIDGHIYTGDISALDPGLIEKAEVLKDPAQTAIYGARAANGVVMITTRGGSFKTAESPGTGGADFDETFLESVSQTRSIRNNFSDYAFWQPRLVTDEDGRAGFDVTFPDDVTSWETHYLAMNGKGQSGQAESVIKSYKPLMAQLAVPNFMVRSDIAFAIGKVLNYTDEPVKVTTCFETGDGKGFERDRVCVDVVLDTLNLAAAEDSMKVTYYLEREDGYRDGEQRDISVYPAGLQRTTGSFHVLEGDASIIPVFDPGMGTVVLYAGAGYLDVMEDEISHLIHYKYSCNEQIASKLKALLAERLIAMYRGEKYKHEDQIDKMIGLLEKNRVNGLWGWWRNSREDYWISLHVLEALSHARLAGFRVELDEEGTGADLVWKLQGSRDIDTRIRILRMLRVLGYQLDYQSHISNLDAVGGMSLHGMLQVMELKQLCSLPCNTDTLDFYRKETLLGNVYFSDGRINRDLRDNDIQNTLLAYRILRNDSVVSHSVLASMRNYLLEIRNSGYWTNTYESAQVIETLLPDLVNGDRVEPQKPLMTISGDMDTTLTAFPCKLELDPRMEIVVHKMGDFPLYLTSYQQYWDPEPEASSGDFIITTRFEGTEGTSLTAGKETKLVVSLDVKKDAEYVMINVPIPAGCSYAEKGAGSHIEAHREYFKQETSIFCEKLREGRYTFEINLIPRFTGSYTLNPAWAGLMYFPTFGANNAMKRVVIK